VGTAALTCWLLKSDPETYSFDDLERDGRTIWDGVRNNQALIYLRKMQKGDPVLVYHSGGDKQVVGLAEIVGGPYPDPKQSDPKLVVVDLKPKQRFPRPVTLAQIKADGTFADFGLVRMSRLSVMPVSLGVWERLLRMGGL
jgi:predicted RNA-binding protein with PUA-like domain